jgi:hypothetical protein
MPDILPVSIKKLRNVLSQFPNLPKDHDHWVIDQVLQFNLFNDKYDKQSLTQKQVMQIQ